MSTGYVTDNRGMKNKNISDANRYTFFHHKSLVSL